MHRIPAAFLIACVAVLHGISAFAAVPSAALSTTPGCLAYCPQGDIVMTVIVRDLSNFLVSNALVRIDFSGCPGIKACAPDGTESYTIGPGPVFTKPTGTHGEVTFPIRAGGVCQGNPTIIADGILLQRYMGAASSDQGGNLVVDNADEVILASKVGSTDVTGDLDCDHVVTTADQAMLRTHAGHACPGVVPVAPRTWGGLKLIYR